MVRRDLDGFDLFFPIFSMIVYYAKMKEFDAFLMLTKVIGMCMPRQIHALPYRKTPNNFSCYVKLLQIIITAQQLMVSPDQSKGQIRRFHRFNLHLASSSSSFDFFR